MREKRSKANRSAGLPIANKKRGQGSRTVEFGVTAEKLRSAVSTKHTSSGNEYLCAIEKNQNGKYNVRVRAVFGSDGWSLPVYFLASSFNAAMKKLEEALQLLQKNEERLRFCFGNSGCGSIGGRSSPRRLRKLESSASAPCRHHCWRRCVESWPTRFRRNDPRSLQPGTNREELLLADQDFAISDYRIVERQFVSIRSRI
jgi:hypothetical protein